MPGKVVLIGDSIRMGYQDVVKAKLQNLADVWGPAANCGDSSRVLDHVDDWIAVHEPDIVHLNCGLHDLKREYDSTEQQVPVEQYAVNLEAIFEAVLDGTNARLIWATTTPVNEQWHREKKDFERLEARVADYNAAAAEIVGRRGLAVDDLYDVIMRVGRDTFLSPDGVHFNDAGYEILGEAVADSIQLLL